MAPCSLQNRTKNHHTTRRQDRAHASRSGYQGRPHVADTSSAVDLRVAIQYLTPLDLSKTARGQLVTISEGFSVQTRDDEKGFSCIPAPEAENAIFVMDVRNGHISRSEPG